MPTSSRPRTVVRSLAGISTAAVVLAGCGLTEGRTGAEGAIAVTATDSECQVARTEAPAGQIEFTVRNTGTKVNEFYVYAEGDRVMGEVENIGPGGDTAAMERSTIEAQLEADRDWVPTGEGQSLYLRPFMFATEAFLGVRPAKEVRYMVIASPAGNYFGGELKPVTIWVSRDYARAGKGGMGAAKTGGNYAASLLPQLQAAAKGADQVVFLDQYNDDAIEELGGMNVFFVHADGRLVTPALTGTILEGVTRSSILQLGRDMGLTVEERRVTLAEWAEGVRSGEITEVFACGTAAVVTPIGRLLDGDDVIESAGGTDVTLKIRAELEGIQTGRVEDRHGWLHRLV